MNLADQGLSSQLDQHTGDSAQRAKSKSRLPPPSKVSTSADHYVSHKLV